MNSRSVVWGNTMYKCHVEKHILNDNAGRNDYTALCYRLELDQAPVLVQELKRNRGFSKPILHIIWDADEACFYSRVADEIPHFHCADEFSHDWLVGNFKQLGWSECPGKIGRVE